MIGLGQAVGISRIKGLFRAIQALFQSGEKGVWYDPSDINLSWRTNLLRHSEGFDNTSWGKNGGSTITPDVIVAPDGSSSADKLVEGNTLSQFFLTQSPGTVSGTLTLSIYAKAGERDFMSLQCSGHDGRSFFNLLTGTVTYAATGVTAQISSAGNGWYHCTHTITVDTTNYVSYIFPAEVSGTTQYTGDGTSGIYIWGAQLNHGSTATPYQKMTDGVSDYLVYGNPLPRMFQGSKGDVPVTAVEQPVGLILDKSQGLVLGPNVVVNGTFDTDTSWNKSGGWTISGGAARNTGAQGAISQVTTLPVDSWYEIAINVISLSASSVYLGFLGGSNNFSPSIIAPGEYKFILKTPSANPTIYIATASAGECVIDDVVFKELPGNHATQATTASKPVLRARYNLLTYSEQFDNAAWGKSNSTFSGTALTRGANNAIESLVFQSLATQAVGTTFAYTVRASPGSSGAYLYLRNLNINDALPAGLAVFDLEAGTVLAAGSAYSSVTITPVDGGQFDCTVIGTKIGATAAPRLDIGVCNTASNVTGVAGQFVNIHRASLVYGLTATPYQRIAAAADYDTVGFKPYLAFDGVDDFLVTPTIDFTGTDKLTVFAGATKLALHDGMVIEHSTTAGANLGTFYLYATSDNVAWRTLGSLAVTAGGAAGDFPVGAAKVCSGTHDIGGDFTAGYLNKVLIASTTTDAGTGNFGNYPMYIGRRAGTSLPFNGRLHSLIVRGALSDATQIANAESYVNSKTGAY